MGNANLKTKILLSFFAAGSISMYGFVNTAAAAQIVNDFYTGNDTGGVLEITGDLPSEAENVKGLIGKFVDSKDFASNSEYKNNVLKLNNTTINGKDIYGFYQYNGVAENVKIYGNKVEIYGGSLTNNNLFGIAGARVSGVLTGKSEIYENSVYMDGLQNAVIYDTAGAVGEVKGITVKNNKVTIKDSSIATSDFMFYGICGGVASLQGGSSANENTVEIISSTVVMKDGQISGGYSKDYADKNNVIIENSKITGNIIGAVQNDAGVPDTLSGQANENNVILSGKNEINGSVYGAYIDDIDVNGKMLNNKITLQGTADGMSDMSNAILYGSSQAINGKTVDNNKLVIDSWSGNVKGAYNFSDIDFNNINWQNGGTVLNITNNTEIGSLANTNINLNSLNFAGGAELKAGDSMTFVNGEKLGIKEDKVKIDDNFTAGVATVGSGAVEVADDGNSVKYTLTEVKQNSQVNLVAENRAVAAAFVNQGTDLISDSLGVLSRDDNYGVKTFAAVHGNRSKYDVNSDIKINGWSTIVGVGNADKFADSDKFSWGVFYENGSGNYRTFNEFNNEFLRGDGSLVYNGGGIAARYKNVSGVYTEASLRAGMLKSDMDNALRDGAGNYYGYESESAYYGVHIGVGKIISLSESSDLDVYSKFFHTYTEGDRFNVAGDEFEFDSINSDRLRVGARITANRENKFSAYYGLAYEYEFNGDAAMKVQGISAPIQSLQGSSYMAELGLNYQPTPNSPWRFDLNLRGYAGERQGGSFNVQAAYTF